MDKQFNHIMIDGETLSTKRNAVIPSIGLVKFDPATGETGERLHVVFDVQEQIDNGYDVSASTLAFWLKQEGPARRYLAGILDKKDPHVVTRTQGMTHVYNFINDTRNAKVWGNGISFDLGLLIEEFEANGLPWEFWNERDVRTVVELCHMFNMPNYKNDIPMGGIAHRPVDDCLHQIAYTSRIIQHLAIPFEATLTVHDETQFSYADHARAEEAATKAEFNLDQEMKRKEGMPAALGMPYGEKLSHDATYDKPKRKKAMVAIVRTLHEAKNYGDTAYRVAVNDMLVASGINPKDGEVLITFNSIGTLGLEVLATTLSKMAEDANMTAATRDTIKKADKALCDDIQTMLTQAYREAPQVDSLLVKMGLPLKRDISAELKELPTDALVNLAVELRFFVLPPKVKGE